MKVKLQFRGPLAKKLQDGFIEIELEDDANLSDLLVQVIKRESDVRNLWSSPEVIDRDAVILCNETDIGLSGGLETELTDGDVVIVLPLIHGG